MKINKNKHKKTIVGGQLFKTDATYIIGIVIVAVIILIIIGLIICCVVSCRRRKRKSSGDVELRVEDRSPVSGGGDGGLLPPKSIKKTKSAHSIQDSDHSDEQGKSVEVSQIIEEEEEAPPPYVEPTNNNNTNDSSLYPNLDNRPSYVTNEDDVATRSDADYISAMNDLRNQNERLDE